MTAIRTIWQCGNIPISTLSNLCVAKLKYAGSLSIQRMDVWHEGKSNWYW